MKVKDLSNEQLDFYTARAQGWEQTPYIHNAKREDAWKGKDDTFSSYKHLIKNYTPTTNGQQCFDLIEKFEMVLIYQIQIKKLVAQFSADVPTLNYDDDPKVAVCRAVVHSVYGDEVSDE